MQNSACSDQTRFSIMRRMKTDASRMPAHVAIIMDGNGRWAKARSLPRLAGHEAGARAVRRVTTHARKMGLQALTLYAFSEQNWGRPPQEVMGLMDLLAHYIVSERHEILDNDIRFSTIGDVSRLPPSLQEAIAELKAASASNQGMDFCIALSYGGREEILRAARVAAIACLQGELTPDEIDGTRFENWLYTAHLPPVDLVIRTSGEWRISNFLLWQCAYAEFWFTPVLWPDFGEKDLDEAISHYISRERRFGLTSEQLYR